MTGKKMTAVRTFALAISAAMIIGGAMRGEMAVVLHKAVNICLECIGLG